jgi:hypothetical protein
VLALEFGEPDVAALQRRITWRQYRRWRIFNRLHPIDSRDRIDAVIARAAVVIASATGAKNLKNSHIDIAGFVPAGTEVDEHALASMTRNANRPEPKSKRRQRGGLDPALFEAFGKSDGSKSR